MSDPSVIGPSPATESNFDTQIPPLEEGQRLDRIEFERRYEAMPHVKKAELIEGVVRMPPPVSLDSHGEPHMYLGMWLTFYHGQTPGLRVGDNSTIRLDLQNEPQPDALLMIRPECGGQARTEEGYVVDAPELVAEVSSSRVAVDRGPRLRAYQASGVREYIVWSVDNGVIEWFVNRNGTFQLLIPDGGGIIRSDTFPGLWLNVPAMLAIDFQALITSLQQGIASPEHQAFVADLQRRRATP
jgi:Uma2 family endonuclease